MFALVLLPIDLYRTDEDGVFHLANVIHKSTGHLEEI